MFIFFDNATDASLFSSHTEWLFKDLQCQSMVDLKSKAYYFLKLFVFLFEIFLIMESYGVCQLYSN